MTKLSSKTIARPVIALVVLALISSACGTAGPETVSCAPGEAPLNAVLTGLIAADNAADLERVLDYYMDTVIWLPPDGEALIGKHAIRPRYERLFRDFHPAIKLDIHETIYAEALGVVRGRTHGHLLSASTGDAVLLDDKFLAILKCRESRWQISHLTWSPRDAHQ